MARGRTWVLSRHRAAVLVADHSALAEPATMATMDDDSLSVAGRPAEHRPVCSADFFRAHSLSDVARGPAPMEPLGARRSGCSRGTHVGAWVCDLFSAAGCAGPAFP